MKRNQRIRPCTSARTGTAQAHTQISREEAKEMTAKDRELSPVSHFTT